jgi:hypothetical protein
VILNALRGDLVTFNLTVPEDLDDLDFTFTVKRHLLDPDDDAVIAQDGLTSSEGTVSIVLTPQDTDQFADGDRLYWDLQADSGTGEVTTPLRGKLVIAADVTLTASEQS